MAEFRVTAPRDTSAMGAVYGAPQDSSVQRLRQYLPTAMGDFLADREQQALAPVSGREMAGDVISTAMNIMPAGRMAVPRSGGIRAYHGSPYDFDRFDLSRIGTGEGAQAYGHGLYFAENPKVAAEYKAKLAPANAQEAIAQTVAQKYGMDWSNMSGYERQSMIDRVAGNPDFAGMISDRLPKGKMYEVNINAKPEQFLDWDRPIGQQHPQVQQAVQQVYSRLPESGVINPANKTGQSIYDVIGGYNRPDPTATSAQLRDAGIPGIRYLDQGSRMPSYTGNPAEMLIKEYGSLEGALKEVQGRVQGALSPDVKSYWSKRLNDLQGYPKPTSNYVLFNDKIIDILKKWGLAGGMAGAGAASQDQSSQ